MNDQPIESTDDQVQPLCADVQARLDAHLDAIDRILDQQGEDRSARRAITDEIESQIREQLAQRTSRHTPNLTDLETLLVEMDPPKAYGESQDPLRSGKQSISDNLPVLVQPTPSLSRTALVGTIIGLIAWPLAAIINLTFRHYAINGGIQTIVPVLIILGPIMMILLGITALGQIARSKGELQGKSLAWFDIIFFPILLPIMSLWWT